MPKVTQATAVRLLTIVFTPVAAAFTAWGAKQGLNLAPAAVVTVGVGAGASVLGLGWHWLSRQPVVIRAEADWDKLVSKIVAAQKADPALNIAAHNIEGLFDHQTNQLITVIGSAVHAPPSVEAVAKQVVAALIPQSAQAAPTTTTTIIESNLATSATGATLTQ